MDELYRCYRIAVTAEPTRWLSRITHVTGRLVPSQATATLEDGPAACIERSKAVVDRYIAFLNARNPD